MFEVVGLDSSIALGDPNTVVSKLNANAISYGKKYFYKP